MADAPANKSTWTAFLKSIATFSGDLSSLTAPSFILSGTSILEYSAYWAEHPTLLLDIKQDEPEARMLACVKWYCSTLKGQFSARHESAGGEKKPLNPVLGEEFHGSWPVPGSDKPVTLTAEQVSHHPPISSYRIAAPNGIILQGHNGQKSGFSGRTIIVKQIGHALLEVPLKERKEKEQFLITLPQLSLEGLFFGAPYAELTDKSYIAASSGWTTVFEYSGAGWLSGKKNTLKASIFPPDAWERGEAAKHIVEGQWTQTLTIRPYTSRPTVEDYKPFVEAHAMRPQHIQVKHTDTPYDSRTLWFGVAQALKEQDFETASKLKSEIENAQRRLRKEEKEQGRVWERKYFVKRDQLVPEVRALADKVKLEDAGYWHFKDTN